MSTNPQISYQSYLLRLWRSSPHSPWHGSLQNTANGEKQSFADLPALVAFLVGQLGEEDAALVRADLAALANYSGKLQQVCDDQQAILKQTMLNKEQSK